MTIIRKGKQAKVTSLFITLQCVNGKLGLRSYGEYHDTLVRGEDGRWRIKEKLMLTKMTNV